MCRVEEAVCDNTKSVDRIGEKLDNLEGRIVDGVTNSLSQVLRTMAFALQPDRRTTTRAELASPNSTPASEPLPAYRPTCLQMQTSIGKLYNEWYGVGEYHDIPATGGLSAFYKENGNKWANTIKGMRMRISRQRRLSEAIQREINAGKELESVCNDWNDYYMWKGNPNLSNIIQELQEQKKIKKQRDRGKKRDLPIHKKNEIYCSPYLKSISSIFLYDSTRNIIFLYDSYYYF